MAFPLLNAPIWGFGLWAFYFQPRGTPTDPVCLICGGNLLHVHCDLWSMGREVKNAPHLGVPGLCRGAVGSWKYILWHAMWGDRSIGSLAVLFIKQAGFQEHAMIHVTTHTI